MGTVRRLGLASFVAAATAIAIAAPAAGAGTPNLIITPPFPVRPGEGVTVLGACGVRPGNEPRVTSDAFVGGAARLIENTPESFFGSGVVAPVPPGTYPVKLWCGGVEKLRGSVTVR